jgi:non-heme chloroperoxidase
MKVPRVPKVPKVPKVGLVVVLTSVLVAALAAQPAWRDPSPHEVRFVTVDSSVRLEVLDWGGTGRPIVFLGCYLSGHVFDEIGPKLTDRFHVYAFTRRGIGASDRTSTGYDLQRSVDDLLEVLDTLQMRKPILVGNSCAGNTQTLLAVQHPERLGGLVYLEAAEDPMLTLADYNLPPIDEANLPKRIERPALDYTSFDAYRRTQKARSGVAFPEAELRSGSRLNADGSMGQATLSPTIRRAITVDARRKPEYARIRVPVLAVFRTPPPFEEIARGYEIQNDLQRAALRQQSDVERLMTTKWENDLRAGVPAAKIVELPGASLYMFLSNEADVIREVRAFEAAIALP